MWYRLALGLVLAGCGFRSGAASGGGSDGGLGDAAIDGPDSGPGDGSSAPPGCFGHWLDGSVAIDSATVTEIMELSSTGHDFAPWISSDGLRIYFSRDLTPPGHGDIYSASRDTPTGTFAAAALVPSLNSAGHEGRAWLTSNELAGALSTTRDGPLNIDTTGRVVGLPFSPPGNGHLTMVNAKGTMRPDPFITDDLLRLYFSADTGPSGKWQIWIAARSTTGDDFGTPSLVITDNSINYSAPALYQNEQLLLFSSFPNNMPSDLYYATRSSAGSFGTPVKIPTVNTGSSESEAVLSHDGCELYFTSDRDPGGHFHLFHAQVTR